MAYEVLYIRSYFFLFTYVDGRALFISQLVLQDTVFLAVHKTPQVRRATVVSWGACEQGGGRLDHTSCEPARLENVYLVYGSRLV